MTVSARASIEMFHLVFLRALVAKGDDKALIALKAMQDAVVSQLESLR